MNKAKTLAMGALIAVASVAGSAMAVGPDFSTILAGLDNSTAITAVVAAGVILAGVGFAKWATKKVARFFG